MHVGASSGCSRIKLLQSARGVFGQPFFGIGSSGWMKRNTAQPRRLSLPSSPDSLGGNFHFDVARKAAEANNSLGLASIAFAPNTWPESEIRNSTVAQPERQCSRAWDGYAGSTRTIGLGPPMRYVAEIRWWSGGRSVEKGRQREILFKSNSGGSSSPDFAWSSASDELIDKASNAAIRAAKYRASISGRDLMAPPNVWELSRGKQR